MFYRGDEIEGRSDQRPVDSVEKLEPRVLFTTIPNDPDVGYQLDRIGAYEAYDITTGSSDVIIAIIDTGIYAAHPDLAANIFINTGEIAGNGLDDDENGFVDDVSGWDFAEGDNDPEDLDGHGTHVAGTAAAVGNNAEGVTGASWNTKILPIKVFDNRGDFTRDGYLEGIKYVADLKRRGFNIVAVNASLGGFKLFPFLDDVAIEELGDVDVLFIAAAGNSAADVDSSLAFPAKSALNRPNVITVAASDQTDALAVFTNFGFKAVQVVAPGVDIFSTYSPLADADLDGIGDGVLYETLSGTSMSAPLVAGLAALLKSANPLASGAQIKDAILRGVDLKPEYDQLYSLPPVVSTIGRVNAYNSVRIIQNQHVRTGAGPGGSWQGVFGGQGAVVVGNSTTFPSFVNAFLNGVTERILENSTTRRAALQKIAGDDRVVGYWESASSMTVRLDFQAGDDPRRVELYFTDFDKRNRTQILEVFDTTTATALYSESISDFENGKYVVLELAGSVTLRVTRVSGPSAVLSGIFFDAPPTPAPDQPVPFAGTDGVTGGRWKNRYGTEGAFVVGESTAFPSFANVNVIGATLQQVRSNTTARNAVERVSGSKSTVSYLSTASSMTFDFAFTDDETHRVGFYVVDFDKKKRAQRFDVVDETGGVLLASTDIERFEKGKYVFFDLSGNVKVRVTNLDTRSAVVSGIFFDVPPTENGYLRNVDTATGGNWRTRYGFEDAYIVGDSATYPSFASLTTTGGVYRELRASTADTRALLRVNSNFGDRILAYYETRLSMDFDISFNDTRSHRVTLYAVDFEKKNRRQRVDIINTDTGETLSTLELKDFKNGKYLQYDLAGNVTVRVTSLGGKSAVLSGIFFD